jgi:hypothetical protein
MYYRWPHVALPLSNGMLALSAAMAVALPAAIAAIAARRRDLLFFAIAPLVLLAPYTGLFYVGFWSADRYVYLAAFGPLVLGAVALRELARRGREAALLATGLAAMFLAGSAAKSWQHQQVWRDDAALWEYEAHRSQPSLLAIQSLARSYLKRAEASRSQEERARWLARAGFELDRGFARRQELAFVPTRYGIPEVLHVARLHYLQGRVAELSGAPASHQVVHHRRAFELAPERLTAIHTSRGLFEMAADASGDRRRQLIERSFDYFVHYLEMSQSDPLQLAEAHALLDHNYAGRFPYLDERIEETRRLETP